MNQTVRNIEPVWLKHLNAAFTVNEMLAGSVSAALATQPQEQPLQTTARLASSRSMQASMSLQVGHLIRWMNEANVCWPWKRKATLKCTNNSRNVLGQPSALEFQEGQKSSSACHACRSCSTCNPMPSGNKHSSQNQVLLRKHQKKLHALRACKIRTCDDGQETAESMTLLQGW